MEIKQIILADYANVSREGKLNVLGIFSNISARAFPVVHPQMVLIINWEAGKTEAGKAKKLEIQLVDDDGKLVMGVGGEVLIPDGRAGHVTKGHYLVPIMGLRFDKAGEFAFHVSVNGDEKGSAELEVVCLPPKGEK